MPDIDKLGLISLNYDTTHRKVAADDSIDNSKSPIQTEGGKCKQFKVEEQEAETQSKQNADNTMESPTVTNATVMGNNNNDLIADTGDNGDINFISELLSTQSFVSHGEKKWNGSRKY